MNSEDRGQGGYYRAIAKEFIERRGAPFFLSPRDMVTIAGWESRRVPLEVVLEGIARTFERSRGRGRGSKGLSLAHCERDVERALQQHRDRAAGQSWEGSSPSGRSGRARRAVERALRELPPDDGELHRLYRSALEALSGEAPDEEALESIEASVERLLYDRAGPEERSRSEGEARRDLPGARPADIEALSRTKIIKMMRQRGRVPYVSLFYY